MKEYWDELEQINEFFQKMEEAKYLESFLKQLETWTNINYSIRRSIKLKIENSTLWEVEENGLVYIKRFLSLKQNFAYMFKHLK